MSSTAIEELSEAGKQYLATAQRELARVAQISAQALGFYRSTHVLKRVFLNLWATDREQTEGVERAAVQFRHDHTSGASEF